MDTSFRQDIVDVLDALLLEMPGVKRGKIFGFPGYKVGGKVFTAVGGDALGVKLPAARVADLIASDDPAMQPFEVAEGTVWKEWLSIKRDDAEAYRGDVALFEESAQYVGGK